MDNIISFGDKSKVAPEIETYDYTFSTKDGQLYTKHGVLTMNPMFYGVTDVDNHLVFSVAADQVVTVERSTSAKAGNA